MDWELKRCVDESSKDEKFHKIVQFLRKNDSQQQLAVRIEVILISNFYFSNVNIGAAHLRRYRRLHLFISQNCCRQNRALAFVWNLYNILYLHLGPFRHLQRVDYDFFGQRWSISDVLWNLRAYI